MKLFKRLLSTALALIMVASVMVTGASAAGNPLPDQSRNGNSSIIVHKFGIDASYETTYVADGKVISNPETVIGKHTNEKGETVDVKLKDLNPLEGIDFKIERVVEKKDQNGDIIVPVVYEDDNTFTPVIKSTDTNGIITFGNLKFGIYRITEQPSAAVTKAAEPSYISVPMNNPENASEWLYDIHIYPKNQIVGPNIDKSVSYPGNQHDTVDLTEQVKWIITTQIPADVANSKSYVITDDLHKVLRYASSPTALEVSYIDDETGAEVVLTEGSENDYILSYTQGTSAYPWKDSLKIELTEKGRKKIANALSPEADAPLPRLTTVFYTKFDIPDENVKEYLGVAIENQAKLNYTNSANVTYTPESEIPEVHTGGVRLKKVDPKGNVLGGAEFKIYRSLDDAKAGIDAIKDPTDSSKDWVVTSNASNGMAEFLGLSYGTRADGTTEGDAHNASNAETKYWIVEVTAPKDANDKPYNLLKEPLEVVVNATSHDNSNIITVVNSNFTLPLTGGTGTMLFILVGFVLVASGVYVFIASKKKKHSSR